MRVFVTGGAGFIGRAVVRRLVSRGDSVVAMVRDPDRAAVLVDLGVELRTGDLSRTSAMVDAMRGADAAIHLAGDYRVGIPARERPAMLDSNVGATHRMLDAASMASMPRLVVVSTVNAFGNTRGRIVDERYRRDLAEGFLSYYDETKFLAHRAAEERMTAGEAVIVVMPGGTYGPDDHSVLGRQLALAHRGALRYRAMTDTGFSFAHVDDVAAGMVGALDRGRIGESYVLGGENLRVGDALRVAARVGGHGLPRLAIPPGITRVMSSITPARVARAVGLPDDLPEVARAGLGVTYWASSAKAATELGYVPRDLASGVRAWLGDG